MNSFSYKIDPYNESNIRGNPVYEYINRNKHEQIKNNKYIKIPMQRNKFVKYMNEFTQSLDWKRITRDLFQQMDSFDSIDSFRNELYTSIISQHKSDYKNIVHVLNSQNHLIKVNTLKIIISNHE